MGSKVRGQTPFPSPYGSMGLGDTVQTSSLVSPLWLRWVLGVGVLQVPVLRVALLSSHFPNLPWDVVNSQSQFIFKGGLCGAFTQTQSVRHTFSYQSLQLCCYWEISLPSLYPSFTILFVCPSLSISVQLSSPSFTNPINQRDRNSSDGALLPQESSQHTVG